MLAEQRMEVLLVQVMNELAYEIQTTYDDEAIGMLAADFSIFHVYRGAMRELRRRKLPISPRLRRQERRIRGPSPGAWGSATPRDEKVGTGKTF